MLPALDTVYKFNETITEKPTLFKFKNKTTHEKHIKYYMLN